jgi:hypothetical protein
VSITTVHEVPHWRVEVIIASNKPPALLDVMQALQKFGFKVNTASIESATLQRP